MGILNRDGALWMATGVDNSGLYSGLNQAEGRVDQFEAHIKRVGDNITRLTGIGFGVAGLKAFGSEIINVRGEMQMLESSFEVLLGGKGVSGFMSEMKQFAVDSPLSMNGVANAAQTLLGFGISAEKVMPTIKQIGDISMGNEDRFKSLSLAFAQMSATGKLMGQDLLQMINAGFNPLQTISEKTGKSIGDLKKEMENGSISSQMVADAFASATAQGGKFYGMTQKQAEGIRGLQAQLEGGLQDAFNEIGKSQEGLIAGGYKVATSLVENYKVIGEALTALIATYGLYKAVMVFNTSIDKTVTVKRYEAEIAELTKLLPLKEQEANADLKAAVASGKLTEEKAKQLIALRAEIESRRESIQSKLAEEQANLKALYAKRAEAKETLELARAKTAAAKEELSNAIATAQAEVSASLQKKMGIESEKQSRAALRIVKLEERKDAAIEQARALKESSASVEKVAAKNREIAAIQSKIAAARQEEIQHGRNVAAMRAELIASRQSITSKEIETLTNKVNTLSEQENAAATTHNGLIKQTVAGKVLIKKIATDADTASTQINTAVTNANTVSTNFLAVAKNRAAAAAKNLWAAIAPNPYLLAAAAVVALGYGIYKLVTATSIQETAQKALNKVLDEAKQKKDDLSGKTDDLIGIVNSETKTVFDQIEAYQKLQGLYPKYLANMSRQEFQTLSLTEQQKLLNKAISEFDISNRDAILDKYRDMYAEIQRIRNSGDGYSYDSAISNVTDALDISFWRRLKMNGAEVEELLQQHIRALEEQKKQREINLKQAEFEALPEEKKREIYKKQLLELEKQKTLIESQIPNIEGINSTWVKLNPTFAILNNQLGDILSKIADTKSKLENKPISKNKSFWETQKKNAEAALESMDKSEKGSVKWNAQLKLLNEANTNLKAWDFSGKSDKKAQEAADKMREASLKLLNLQAELDNESVKQQLDHEQQLLDIEQDSFDKRYRQNQLNAAKEFLSVEDYRQKMAKAQQDAAKDIYIKKNGNDTGFNFTTFDKTLLPDGLRSDSVEAQANKMVEAITSAYKKGNEDIARDKQAFLNEENMIFASELDKQLDSIRTHYEQRRKEAGTDAELLKKINENEIKETSSARLQSRQKQLEADADYNQKYIQLVTDRYAFEADKRKVALQQQIKDQEAIISNLSNQLLNDPNNDELANQLRAARLELKQFNKELDNTTADKFLEIANGVSGVASSLRSALDDFGISFSENANKVADGAMQILEGGSKIAEGAKNMDISGMIQGAITQTQGYFNIIGGLFGPNGTAEYEGIKSQLESINKIYESIIANSKEDIVFGGGFATINAASTALDNYNKKVINLQKIAAASGGAGAAWNSHSAAWHTNKNVGADNFMSMGKIIDKSVTTINDLYNLTGDELYLIQSQMPEAWDKIDGRIKENLQSIIDCKDEANELKDALNEALTGVSQDAFYNDFINNLSDMSISFEDMCDDFEGYLRKSIIAGLVADQYKDKISALYQSWSDAAKSDGRITEDEAKKLKEEYKSIVEQMMKDREGLADSFGWDTSSGSSQSSTRGGSETITQDQAGSIDGRLTGIHETDIRIEQNTLQLILLASERNNILKGYTEGFQAIRNVLVESMFLLQEIRDSNDELYEIKDTLIEIKKNTKGLVTK